LAFLRVKKNLAYGLDFLRYDTIIQFNKGIVELCLDFA
jgi:hypothetical protein